MTANESKKDLAEWAKQFSKDNKAGIDQFLKYGSPYERAVFETVLEIAEATA